MRWAKAGLSAHRRACHDTNKTHVVKRYALRRRRLVACEHVAVDHKPDRRAADILLGRDAERGLSCSQPVGTRQRWSVSTSTLTGLTSTTRRNVACSP
jgi:hypothetical protein